MSMQSTNLTICTFLPLFLLLSPIQIQAKATIPITIEQAATPKEKTWGLMQRPKLPEDHGMLFIYDSPRKLSFWMFNCLIDLSVAFLDKNSVITEIKELQAYPEMLDPARPVRSLADMRNYPPDDPVLLFFHQRRATSSNKAKYALEMPAGWFRAHGVKPGDKLLWSPNSSQASILYR